MATTDWKQADGRVVRVESISTRGRRQLIVVFSYEVCGQILKANSTLSSRRTKGDMLRVQYDPSNPKLTRFEADYRRTWRLWWFAAATVVAGALLLMVWIHATRR
jgi:Protein of unknown function (DUF3592)